MRQDQFISTSEGFGISGKARKITASDVYEMAPMLKKMPALPRLKRDGSRGSPTIRLLSMQLIAVMSPMEPLRVPKAIIMLKAMGEPMMMRHMSAVNTKVNMTELIGMSWPGGT
jgi:hypothetical protein